MEKIFNDFLSFSNLLAMFVFVFQAIEIVATHILKVEQI
jgi:hypothetical protein